MKKRFQPAERSDAGLPAQLWQVRSAKPNSRKPKDAKNPHGRGLLQDRLKGAIADQRVCEATKSKFPRE